MQVRKSRLILAAAVILVAVSGAAWFMTRPVADGVVGYTRGAAHAPARGSDLTFDLWYPSGPGGRAVTVGGNGVFHGTAAGRDAPRAAGRFPLVLLSHGAGGNAGQFGWIASALATAGYAVALPNHPGSTSGDASAAEAVRLWLRPPDVSAVLDAIEADPAAWPGIDLDRVAVLGFSAGGYVALAVAGARVDPARLATFCDDGPRGMSDCAFLSAGGVDLHAMDLSPAAQDLRDPRVDAAVAIDPGTVETLTEESLAAIRIPVLLVNLGDEAAVPPPVHARAASEAIPQATYSVVPDATHFSFLPECWPRGAAILRDEGELDPLCDDAGGRSRADIHAELRDLIAGWLDATLGPGTTSQF